MHKGHLCAEFNMDLSNVYGGITYQFAFWRLLQINIISLPIWNSPKCKWRGRETDLCRLDNGIYDLPKTQNASPVVMGRGVCLVGVGEPNEISKMLNGIGMTGIGITEPTCNSVLCLRVYNKIKSRNCILGLGLTVGWLIVLSSKLTSVALRLQGVKGSLARETTACCEMAGGFQRRAKPSTDSDQSTFGAPCRLQHLFLWVLVTFLLMLAWMANPYAWPYTLVCKWNYYL